MKLYYFNNKGWGMCWTVMAENIEDARKFVIDRMSLIYASEKTNYPDVWAKRISLHRWNIEEYGVGEVIETERT